MRPLFITQLLPLTLMLPVAAAQTLESTQVQGTLANALGFSSQVFSLGDTDGDGLEDFVVWGTTQYSPETEVARVHSGANGALLHSSSIGSVSESPAGCAGPLGDLNGDGVLEYGVGGRRTVAGQTQGFVRVFSGATSGLLYEILYSSFPFPQGDGTGFATVLARLGDVDGDGVEDIGIGAPGEQGFPAGGGGVYLFSGASGTALRHLAAPPTASQYGQTVVAAGDLNGDTVPDLLVGAPFENQRGAVYAISGSDGTMLYRILAQLPGETFGSQIVAMDDLDLDGRRDFVVGTFRSAGPGTFAHLRAYSGASGALLYQRDYNTEGAQFTWDLCATLDANSDGFGDLLLAAPSDAGAYPGTGLVLLVSGTNGAVLATQEGDLADRGILSVASLGDLTGNGHPDWAVGHFSLLSLSDEGRVQIMWGGCQVQETPSCAVPANSTGLGATLQAVAFGDASSQGRMQLRITDLPPQEFGFVLMAPQGGSVPLASSTLCLGGSVTRLNGLASGLFQSDASGYASRVIDWGAFPQGANVLPGSTWHFQVMHRDRGLIPPFHLTHALAVTF